MFTGLTQQIGTILESQKTTDGLRIKVGHEKWDSDLEMGESVAVNGACLTVSGMDNDSFSADLLQETAERTSLLTLNPGDRVNLERALRPSDRLGGHFVTGHVDETGTIDSVTTQNRDYVINISCSPDLMQLIVEKGSIACNGVSLTVASVGESSFDVKIIPFTWNNTTLCDLKQGDTLNLEADILGKYVYKLTNKSSQNNSLTMEDLQNAGFLG